jgi:hypothetical protein
MAYVDYKVRIEGVATLLMHNGRLQDRSEPATKALGAITTAMKAAKADPPDELVAAQNKMEWFGGLYHTENYTVTRTDLGWDVMVPPTARILIPADNLWACMVKGGSAFKLGTKLKACLLIDEDAFLIHDGPKDINELYRNNEFTLRKRAKLPSKVSVTRVRPRFNKWAADFVISLNTSEVDGEKGRQCLDNAGRMLGLGDWIPRFGRFTIKKWEKA